MGLIKNNSDFAKLVSFSVDLTVTEKCITVYRESFFD